MTMAPRLRKVVLTAHLVSSLGWIGAVMAYLALAVSAGSSRDSLTVRASWIAMELTGWFVIVPLALAALGTGLGMSLGTSWGLVRHYWILVALLLTVGSTVVLLVHMPTVSARADTARSATGADLARMGSDLFHPGVGLAVLIAVAVLNVYKPRGLTSYGRRLQRDRAGQPATEG